jgi:hypothetical protein
MKKTAAILFCVLSLNTLLLAQNEDFYTVKQEQLLDPIEDRFLGVYMSMDFLAALEKTKHYDKAMRTKATESFDDFYMCMVVFKNKIIYWYYFGEGYFAVSKSKFPNYQFEYNDKEVRIIDPYGNIYLKMSENAENHKITMSNYIAKVILRDLIAKGEITIENDIISIVSLNNKKFKVGTFAYVYNNRENLILEEIENETHPYTDIFSLEIENNKYTIYWTEQLYRPYREVKRIIWEKRL